MPAAFDPGLCRYQVTIEQMDGTQDATGQEAQNWTTFATTWASIESLSGNEKLTAAQVYASSVIRIRMRFVDGVTPKMRIVYSDRIFDILDVSDPDGRRRYIECMCNERVERGT